MKYLGTVTEVRDHPIRPVKVRFTLGDGSLELDWLMVAYGAWATLKRSELVPGVQCSVWDTGYPSSRDKYRVTEFWPSAGLLLPDNKNAMARANAPIAISGFVNITVPASGTILAATPPLSPLSHNLKGKILES